MNSTAFFKAALEASWQGSLVILLILLLRPLLGLRVPARWRSLLWTLALLRLLVPAFLLPPSPASLQNISVVDRPFEKASEVLDRAAHPTENAPGTLRSQGPAEGETTAMMINAEAPRTRPWWQISAAVWIAGTVLTALWIFVGTILLHRRLRRDSSDADATVRVVWERCCSRVFPENRSRFRPRLVQSSVVTSPALIGLLRPVLLIPRQGCEDLSPEDWEHIFLHELAHFQRRDHWTHALQLVALCLHWFNPLVWFGFRYLRADRELAADAWALRHLDGRGPVAYGRTLLKMLTAQSHRGLTPGLVGILEDGTQLKQRLRHIRDFTPRRLAGSILGIGVALALAVVVIGRQTVKVDLTKYAGLPPAEILVTAARYGEVAVVQKMLDDGTDINTLTDLRRGRTALSAAIAARQFEVVRRLVERGADINLKAEKYDPPIIAALWNGWGECLDFLLAKGATCAPELLAAARGDTLTVQAYLAKNTPDYDKVKLLGDIAAAYGHRELFALLYDATKQQPEQRDYFPYSRSVFVNAIANGHRGIIEELIARDPNLVPGDSVNRISAAAIRQPGMREWLISKGIKVPVYNDGERLIDAAEREDLIEIRRLLAAGVDVNFRGESDWMPLCKAAVWSCPRAVKLLLENHADPNPPRYSYSTLELANTPEIADLLVAAGAKVKPEDIDYSISQGSVKMVQWFIDHGVDPTQVKGTENSPNLLFQAGSAEVAELLVARGLPVNAKDNDDRTALFEALQRENPAKLVAALLKQGADPNQKNQDGWTPLMFAPDGPTIDALIAGGADIRAINPEGMDVLSTSWNAKPSRREALLKHGAKLTPANGAEMLTNAIHQANEAEVKSLLALGVNPAGSTAWDGRPAGSVLSVAILVGQFKIAALLRAVGANDVGLLSEAAAQGNLAKMKQLLDAGADVNERCEIGRTPLHYAVRQGQSAAVALLLERGAKVDLFDVMGNTPFHWAQEFLFDAENSNNFSEGMDKETSRKVCSEIVNLIAGKRPNPNYRDGKGETALMRCAQYGGLLRSKLPENLDINAQRADGMTALMLAVATQPKDARLISSSMKDGQKMQFSYRGILVEALLEKNADLTLRNQAGETALDLAKKVGNPELLKMLEAKNKNPI